MLLCPLAAADWLMAWAVSVMEAALSPTDPAMAPTVCSNRSDSLIRPVSTLQVSMGPT